MSKRTAVFYMKRW